MLASTLLATLIASQFSADASFVVTHTPSQAACQQPTYPVVGSVISSRGYLTLDDSVSAPIGNGHIAIDSGYFEYPLAVQYFSELDSYEVYGGAASLVDTPSFHQLTLPAVGDVCQYQIARTGLAVDPLGAGDATRDGLFNSADLIAVFRAGEYEDQITHNSTWATGDWNADTEFTSGDLILALQAGTYAPAASAVPEPGLAAWLLLAFWWRRHIR